MKNTANWPSLNRVNALSPKASATVDFALGHAQCIGAEYEGEYAGREELGVAVLHCHSANLYEIGGQHAADEAHGAEYPDGREFLDGIHPGLAHSVVCHRVGYGNSRPIESHAQAIQDEKGRKLHGTSCIHAVESCAYHEQAREPMAERQRLLGRDEAVCNYTHKCGHEDGHDALHGEEPFDLRPEAGVSQIAAERCEVCSPCGIL